MVIILPAPAGLANAWGESQGPGPRRHHRERKAPHDALRSCGESAVPAAARGTRPWGDTAAAAAALLAGSGLCGARLMNPALGLTASGGKLMRGRTLLNACLPPTAVSLVPVATCSGVTSKCEALGFRRQDGKMARKPQRAIGGRRRVPEDAGAACGGLVKVGLVHARNLQNCDPYDSQVPMLMCLGLTFFFFFAPEPGESCLHEVMRARWRRHGRYPLTSRPPHSHLSQTRSEPQERSLRSKREEDMFRAQRAFTYRRRHCNYYIT